MSAPILPTAIDKDTPQRLSTMNEVADRMRVSPRWLQGFVKANPFYRMAGRKKLFSNSDIRRLMDALPCPCDSSRPATANRQTGRSAVRISERPLIELRELLAGNSPRASSQSSRSTSRLGA
jgi:hypothetical protein